MTNKIYTLGLVSCLFVVSTVGCGGNGKKLVQVKGSASFEGKSPEGATILFHPDDPNIQTASGTVTADGTYTLVSGTDPGIAPGTYKVTIIWPDPSKKPTQQEIMMGNAEDGPDLLNGKYATKSNSPLSATIDANTTTIPAFEL